MIIVHGKKVFTELSEVVDPAHTAVLVIDVQNDLCSENGTRALVGSDLSMVKEMIPNIRVLLEAARAVRVRIIYVENVWLPGYANVSAAFLRYLQRRTGVQLGEPEMLPGTWGARTVDEIAPRPGDIVVQKARSSAFVGTPVDMILRSNEIKSVVVVGDVTQNCIESTARDASFYGYYVVIPRDCVGSYDREMHEASLKVMSLRSDVVHSEELIHIWTEAPSSVRAGS